MLMLIGFAGLIYSIIASKKKTLFVSMFLFFLVPILTVAHFGQTKTITSITIAEYTVNRENFVVFSKFSISTLSDKIIINKITYSNGLWDYILYLGKDVTYEVIFPIEN